MKKIILSAAIAALTLSACQSDKTEVSEDDNGVVTLSSKGIDYELLLVNAGTFNIGATSEMKDITPTEELPMHEVKLTKDYYIGKTEVTQELWESVMGNNPSAIKEGKIEPRGQCQLGGLPAVRQETQCPDRKTVPSSHRGRVGVCGTWRCQVQYIAVERLHIRRARGVV